MAIISYQNLATPVVSPISGFRGILPRQEALLQIRQCLTAVENNAFKRGCVYNNITSTETALVGDLHARTDNLSEILRHNGNVDKFTDGRLVLVFLGDAVHSEEDPQEMDSSVQIMQHIFELMIATSGDNAIYVHGNHDYLPKGINRAVSSGATVTQSLLHRQRLTELYGEEYTSLYEQIMNKCPLLAIGHGFAGVHAGPITQSMPIEQIEQLDPADEGNLFVYETQWNRFEEDYGLPNVRRFMQSIGQPDGMLLVGHEHLQGGHWVEQIDPQFSIINALGKKFGYALADNGRVSFVDAGTN